MTVFGVYTARDDVEAVMGAVADALRRWEGGESRPLELSLIQGQSERLTQLARQLTLQWNIDGNAIIHSRRRFRGAWLIRFQILTRRLTWWFLEPILQQIRLFQLNTSHAVDGLAQNQEALMAHVTAMPQKEWESRLEALEAEVVALQREIANGVQNDA
jgi:hypothetical protein